MLEEIFCPMIWSIQREEIKQLSTYLNEKILQMKKEYTNKKKVVLISCLCMGALAVILLF